MISKLFGTDNIMNMLATPSFWYTILIIVGIIVLLYVGIRYWHEGGKYAIIGIFTIGFIVLTGYSAVNLNAYYSARGGIHGVISGIFDTNNVEVVETMNFELKNIELTQVGDTDTYSARINVSEVFNLENKCDYMVYVNDMPCYLVENASDYVKAEYKYSFLDNDFKELELDSLYFNFAFYTNSTSLEIRTLGGSEAVKYWNYYFNKNTFVVRISEVESLEDFNVSIGSGDTSNMCTVTYMYNNEVKGIQVYLKDQTLIPLEFTEEYNAWLYNDKIIDSEFIVNENITLVGEYFNKVEFKDGNKIIYSHLVQDDYFTEIIDNPTRAGYTFIGWSLDGESVVDYKTIKIGSNTTFIALYGYTRTINAKSPDTSGFSATSLAGETSLGVDISNEFYNCFGLKISELKNKDFNIVLYVTLQNNTNYALEIDSFDSWLYPEDCSFLRFDLSENGRLRARYDSSNLVYAFSGLFYSLTIEDITQ